MNRCPKCNSEIDAFFGIFNCPGCQQLLVIDIDGNIQVAEDQDQPSPANMTTAESQQPRSETAATVPFGSDPVPPPPQSTSTQTRALNLSEDETASPLEPLAAQPLTPEQSLKDVLAFANSSRSQGREGMFFFDLTISGIDSVELRKILRESFQDKKLGIDPDLVMKSISKGQLVVKGVSAVKASVLISRLLESPFQIKWEQRSITEPGG